MLIAVPFGYTHSATQRCRLRMLYLFFFIKLLVQIHELKLFAYKFDVNNNSFLFQK